MLTECRWCGGTGQDAQLGTGTYGPIYAGVCWACGGKGAVLVMPAEPTRPKEDHHAPTPEEIEAIRQEEAEHDAWMQAHEHHFS